MLRTILFFSSTVVLFGAMLGCKKAHVQPQSKCYSGVVVGFSCSNGSLVQVDSQYALGAPLRVTYADSLPRPNIIAVVNHQLEALGPIGQRIYFTYVNDANNQTPRWPCLAIPSQTFQVPHLVLSNVSTTPCVAP